ncbi:MAG: glycosyltransferase family 39 protein [Planctomycetota bacterium]|nr:MAG: glycosyltransferase family 39 protein [Planctomycetota bacterium]REJ98584.1 MAG: glycosyltransferase family 39 protein [Planctomycetota bacterium]REK29884.1 MAG: glycosyltransferase family 39 protein [Planctomycetota bacterium]REK47946.1 MAG: glycosyltransferase family 39 protein [Planctomycetota bacterium]
MSKSLRYPLLIALVAGIVIFTNLGAPSLWDEDEPKNARCAYEMYERGDWLVPTFNGEYRTDKPILLYWCQLLAYHILGPTEFAARLPSALCGIGTALLTFYIGRRLLGETTGLWAGLLLSSSLWYVVASRAATPDGLLIFFSTLALWIYLRGVFPVKATSREHDFELADAIPHRSGTFIGMYAAMGMATLAKGPIGVLLPGAVIGCFVLCVSGRVATAATTRESVSWGRQIWGSLRASLAWLMATFHPRRVLAVTLRMRPATALLVVGAIAVPWYIAVGLQTDWEWPKGFFFKHNLERFSAPMEGHSGPPFYHLISIAVCFFPASVFLMPMILNTVRQMRTSSVAFAGLVFAVSWIAVYVVFFSLAGTKLPSYVTPTYPALAVLTGHFIERWTKAPAEISRLWQRIALVVFGLVGIGMMFGLAALAAEYLPGEQWLAAVGGIPLLGAIVAMIASERGQPRRAAVAFVSFAALFSTTLFGWAVLRVDRFQNAEPLASAVFEHAEGPAALAGYRFFRPSWVYYARQPIAHIATEDADAVRAHFGASRNAFLITDGSGFDDLRDKLPGDVEVLMRRPRFLKDGELLLLGRRTPPSSQRQADDSRSPNRF